jgi:hypothetical protein
MEPSRRATCSNSKALPATKEMWFLAFPTTAPLVGSLLVRHRRADLLDVEGQEIIEVDSLSAIRSEVAPPRRPGERVTSFGPREETHGARHGASSQCTRGSPRGTALTLSSG